LGSGFNPEFTGRENVYTNAATLGLSRAETDARFDDIAAFADIGDFIDQPVKIYSSGMMVRLAFAVQAQTSPDVLIVDEALAVGDAKFQAKCFERLRQLKEGGTSILLVTHSTEQIVTHCSEAVLLERGGVMESGAPRNVVNRYLDLLFGKPPAVARAPTSVAPIPAAMRPDLATALSVDGEVFASRPNYNRNEYRWGDRKATILDFVLSDGWELYPAAVESGGRVQLRVAIRFEEEVVRPVLGVTIKTREGVTVYGTNSDLLGVSGVAEAGARGTLLIAELAWRCTLAPGDYFVSLGVASRGVEGVVPHDRRYDAVHLQVKPTEQFFGIADLQGSIEVSGSGA
jgi:lipopolysaccharide transport system ATP-binding protein